ncbi:MAG: hypothetical protein ACRES9_08330 [Gammaproteobacteria bacterium]
MQFLTYRLTLSALLATTVALGFSPALASTNAVMYSPPDMTSIGVAQLKHYYKWRHKMDWLLAPIHTRADLKRYLKKHAKSGSPLDALSPDARKRVLSEVEFGRYGAFLPNYSDLQYLSTQQVYKILALFGEQGWAERFTGGRIRAASPRAASQQPGKPTRIEQGFTKYLKALDSSLGDPHAERARVAEQNYSQLFAPIQTPDSVRKIGNHDLRLLFRATFLTTSNTFKARYARDAQMDFAEMEKRHFAGPPDYQNMYQAFVDTRQYAAAHKLYQAHPDVGLTPFPAYRDEAKSAGIDTPTVLKISTTKRELIHRRVKLKKPALVIILSDPNCHFCTEFDRALQSRPKLHAILDRHSLWLTWPGAVLEFDTLQQWNKAHPRQQINVMYSLQEWPMVKILAFPQFFFLRDGKVVAHHMSWGKNGNFATLESGLEAIGLWK